jgi:protein-S-isoprenylcysteine O-methyltransferase Ste14
MKAGDPMASLLGYILEIKNAVREDWTVLHLLATVLTGFLVAILDFIFLQNLKFQAFALAGLFLLVIGGYLRTKARLELKKKAGFDSLAATARLRIAENRHLVKDGLYRHVRHPIYLGEILRNFGVVSVFSSVYGLLLMAVATGFLFFRIRKEERTLIERFGEEYKEYQRKTKRILP